MVVPHCWNQVTLTVTNDGQAFSGSVRAQVPDDLRRGDPWSGRDVYTLPAEFAHGTTTLRFVLRPRESYQGIRLQCLRGGKVLWQDVTGPTLGAMSSGLALVFVTARQKEVDRSRYGGPSPHLPPYPRVLLTPEEAPVDVRVYDAAVAIVFAETDLSRLPPNAWPAIRQWIAAGGLLVLTAPCLERNAASPELAALIGASVAGRRSGAGLEEALKLFSHKPMRGALTQALDVRVRPQEVLASADGQVLAFEHPVGMGTVRGFAVDPEWTQIPQWESRLRLWNGFWHKALYRGAWEVGPASGLPWSMVPSHSRLSNTGLPLFIALLVFVVVVGPVNCALVSLRRKKELVVVTTPAIALVLVLGLAIASVIVRPAVPVLVHQTANVSTAAAEGVACTSTFGIFSPGTRRYDLTFAHPRPVFYERQPQEPSWPDRAIPLAVSVGEPASLSRVEVERWSMRAFEETSFVAGTSVAGEVALGADGLSGYIVNHLPFVLQDCHLIHKWNHVAVGDLAPGERKPLSLKLGPPTLSDYQLSRMDNLSRPWSLLNEALWPGRARNTRWEQATESIWSGPASGPFVMGWGQALLQPPSLAGRHRVEGTHLYLVSLRTTVRGPDLAVPVGGALETTSHMRSAWLATYPSENQAGSGMPGGAPGGMPSGESPGLWDGVYSAHELLLPIEGKPSRHERLIIHGQMRPALSPSEEGATEISVYDWGRRRWETLTPEVDRVFSLAVPEPGRFILWPPGLVLVAAGRDGGLGMPGYRDLSWVDVEYEGEASGP